MIREAENKGLITVSFNYGMQRDLESRLCRLFLQYPNNQEEERSMWDSARAEIISKMVKEQGIPDFENYYRQELT
jgi:transcriptional accessory protein Tex/SPT6